jgi:GGDEF domain-containing protein
MPLGLELPARHPEPRLPAAVAVEQRRWDDRVERPLAGREGVRMPGLGDLLERSREAVKALGVEPVEGRLLSASIGWAVYPEDADDRSELIGLADAALYRAKSDGRDRVVRADAHDVLAS